MKTYIKLITFVLAVLLLNACEQDYIDSISKVDPGADESVPEITVNFPPEGYELQTNDAVGSIIIDFKVTDDIEVSSILVKMDGSEIVSYGEFKDYRVVMKKYTYDNVTTGPHLLSITASDIDGKSVTRDVNFAKAPPYVPLYEGEVFYMPFNNEFREMNNLSLATAVGSPGFTDGIQDGTAYAGAANSYLTFPSSVLQGSTEISASFWIKLDDAMARAGVLVLAPVAADNNDRTKGFRFFREATNAGTTQRYKLNVGTGSSDSWFDGGAAADVATKTGDWVHMAFSISETEAAVYISGEVVSQGAFSGMDIADCDLISIMSGAPNWTGWDHLSDGSAMDELRIFNKALSQDEIRTLMLKEQASFYMDFNGDFKETNTGKAATVVGSPTFAYGTDVSGDAYVGAANSYLTFSTVDVDVQADEFSAGFWIDINNVPDRAGILTMGPEDTGNAEYPTKQNNRKNGFRFFREASNAGATQRFKLNIGNGTADAWIDGGAAADVDPATSNWVHLAFAIGATEARVYINGVEVKQGTFDGIDWTGCDLLSIMSGVPRFSEWGHLSDHSMMDELYLFKKALTTEEVILLMNDGK